MRRQANRRETTIKAVIEIDVIIVLACQAFCICESCYHYQAKGRVENALTAEWLVLLTDNQRILSFGLCFLHSIAYGAMTGATIASIGSTTNLS